MNLNNDTKLQLFKDFENLTISISEFDKQHIELVMNKSIELAQIRNLDINLVEVIALFHDIGRINENINPNNHANSGSDFLLKYYKNEPFEGFEEFICAIKEHSNKAKVTTPYSELLKDADSYAHSLEFDSIKNKESLRIKYINYPPFYLKWINNEQLYLQIKEYLSKLVDYFDVNDVHQIRVTIRTIRSMIQILKNTTDYKYFNDLDKLLKNIFQSYEYSRKLSVFYPILNSSKLQNKIKNNIDKENKNIKDKMDKETIKLKIMLNSFPDPTNENLDVVIKNILLEYIISINTVTFKDIESLHKLRIKGKMIKYLMELNLVEFNENHYNLLKVLHESIGNLNDIQENRILAIDNKSKLTKKEYDSIKKQLKKSEKILITELKKEVFIMRLLVNRSIY